MFPFGEVITAGAGLLSGGLNSIFQRNQQDKAWQQTVAMWNMQNKYNTPFNQMARFKAAGLNPNLIYGQGNPGNASGAPNYQVSAHTSPFGAALEALTNVANLELIKSQVDKNKVESQRIQSDTKRIDSATAGQDISNRFNSAAFEDRLSILSAENRKAVNAADMSDVDAEYYSDMKSFSAEIAKMSAQKINIDYERAGMEYELAFQKHEFLARSNELTLQAQRLGLLTSEVEIKKIIAQIANIVSDTHGKDLANELQEYARGQGYWRYTAAGSVGTRLFMMDAISNGGHSNLKGFSYGDWLRYNNYLATQKIPKYGGLLQLLQNAVLGGKDYLNGTTGTPDNQ
jgi:hypothetical protein